MNTTAQAASGRIEKWTQKLLDFSARNRLLNIPKASRQVVRLLSPDVGALENALADEKTVTVRSLADVMGETALDDLANGRLPQEKVKEAVAAELARQRLCVALTPAEVKRRMSDLLHDARTSLEEAGVNTLFLTVGELQWVDPAGGAARKSYRAPILLVPVRLQRASMSEGVKMSRLDEDTAVNTTLVEFLRAQFGLTVPGLDPLPADERGVDVARVLGAFREAIGDREGWTVLEEATVGSFSFGKFVMWKDMTERADELKKNPLVSHLVGGGGLFDDGVEVFPADEIAQHLKPEELFCPVSYDSSQLAAVLYSAMGKTFVLHGPPGTGKSQTITNIIAHNLAIGRRVLFVSEKKAALDVVKNRLDRIGLTPFCLELHSNKTEKGRFYEQLKAALNVPETTAPGEWGEVVADFERRRMELNDYVRALHHAYPNGLSAYDCFAEMVRNGKDARRELVEGDGLTQSREAYCAARQAVQDLLTDFRSVAEDALKVTPSLKADAWSPVLERQVATAAEEVAVAAETLLATLKPTSSVPFKELIKLASEREVMALTLGAYRLETLAKEDFDDLDRRLSDNAQSFVLVRLFKGKTLQKELAERLAADGATLTLEQLQKDIPNLRAYVGLGRAFLEKAGFAPDEKAGVDAAGAQQTRAQWAGFRDKLRNFLALAEEPSLPGDLRTLAENCRGLVENVGELRNAMRYQKTLARAKAAGVGAFADYIVREDDGSLDAVRVFDVSHAAKMLDAILAQVPVLAEFSGLGQDERIVRFRALNARYTELSKKAVFARLAATLPRRRSGPCPEGTELGMIKRECEKKTRQKAVRRMLAEAKTLLPTLKPCFLMSPLSVAQYLPVDSEPFDLVVFDEASQIPVWDAIGVIARGRQLVVVGDPKQMPPTNFFQKGESENEDDETEDEAIADQESILDECLVAGVYSTYLKWHYRSRHESLIAFSNAHYYENGLCTFPSAVDSPRLGMKFVFVPDGCFTSSGKGPRVNEKEARALVDYICTTVLQPGYRRRSIGVVTFSMTQQKLIRTMLEERRAADPRLEAMLPEDGEGAYFVKNLENVQGDESDVILFSVGYAPDENGRFTMNFGPLNLSGGERRLNVAVTRSKEQVVVFSSIRASQIDAGEGGRTQAVGAGHLKAFLEYAERGSAAAADSKKDAGRREGFGDVIAAFLEEKGYAVDRAVGCSDYRIDLAVRDPDDAGRYLMGIECDGPAYARQRTAQDRDVNRAGVLKGLGWHLFHAWSVDWAFDRARAEQRVLEALEAIRRGEEPAAVRPEPKAPAPAAVAKPVDPPPPVAEPSAKPKTETPIRRETYKVWTSRANPSSARFYEPGSLRRIEEMLEAAIETEGPIYEDVLRKRVGKVWGISRLTDKARQVFDSCPLMNNIVTEHETGRVYWPRGKKPGAFDLYRVPSADADSKRTADEIPPEELKNAMIEIDADLGGCPQEALYRETVRVFGLSSLTAKARKCLDVASALIQA